jgi:hypothetical protein
LILLLINASEKKARNIGDKVQDFPRELELNAESSTKFVDAASAEVIG